MPDTKICSKATCRHAGEPQPLSEFYVNRGRRRNVCRACYRAQDEARRERIRAGDPVDREAAGRLAIGPWRAWLRDRLVALAAEYDAPREILSWRLGVSEKTVAAWLHNPDTTYALLDYVDRACCNWGDPGLLRDLYPDLYEPSGPPLTPRRPPREDLHLFPLFEQRLERLRELRQTLTLDETAVAFARETGVVLSRWQVHRYIAVPVSHRKRHVIRQLTAGTQHQNAA